MSLPPSPCPWDRGEPLVDPWPSRPPDPQGRNVGGPGDVDGAGAGQRCSAHGDVALWLISPFFPPLFFLPATINSSRAAGAASICLAGAAALDQAKQMVENNPAAGTAPGTAPPSPAPPQWGTWSWRDMRHLGLGGPSVLGATSHAALWCHPPDVPISSPILPGFGRLPPPHRVPPPPGAPCPL